MKDTKLIIGCGKRPEEDATNLDIVKLRGVDVVHNLDVFPYPFKDNQFEEVIAEDVLEHVENIIAVMEEIWRIMKLGGRLWIRGPHAKYPEQLWKDPTHKRGFVPESFDYWDSETHYGKQEGHITGKAKFKITERVEKNLGMEFTMTKI